jgi:outer membrane lipoprotein carrier protein
VQPNQTVVLACVLASVALVHAQARSDAEAFAERLQAKYDTIRDFSADFVHVYKGGVLRQSATERGHVLVKKPGRMRWEYTSPEPKLFVSDGRRLYSYIPQDRQVLVTEVPSDDDAATPVLFLTGKGRLTRDFTPSFDSIPEAPPGTVGLKLVPRRPEPEYEWLAVGVEPGTLRIVALATVDAQGGRSAFTFSSVRENVGVDDNSFVFKVPRGVDLVTGESGR